MVCKSLGHQATKDNSLRDKNKQIQCYNCLPRIRNKAKMTGIITSIYYDTEDFSHTVKQKNKLNPSRLKMKK